MPIYRSRFRKPKKSKKSSKIQNQIDKDYNVTLSNLFASYLSLDHTKVYDTRKIYELLKTKLESKKVRENFYCLISSESTDDLITFIPHDRVEQVMNFFKIARCLKNNNHIKPYTENLVLKSNNYNTNQIISITI